MATKVITLHLTDAVTPFFNLLPNLSAGLDVIAAAFGQGPVAVGTAYAAQHGAASALIKTMVLKLSITQLGYLSGLGYTQPATADSQRIDVGNSVLAAWDVAASAYMHGKKSDGDAAKIALHDRLQQFDAALQTSGKTAVTPDK